jgi:hypothetical protein
MYQNKNSKNFEIDYIYIFYILCCDFLSFNFIFFIII